MMRFRSSDRAATSGKGMAAGEAAGDEAACCGAGAGAAVLGWVVPSKEPSAPAVVFCARAMDARHSSTMQQARTRVRQCNLEIATGKN